MKVYQLNILATKADHEELNRVGWNGHPKYEMMADITVGGNKQLSAAQAAYTEGFYKLVATLDSDDLEDGFRLTNSIARPWQENEYLAPGVNFKAHAYRARSTTVGDIIEKDGEYFLVASIGFNRLDMISKAAA